MVFDKTSHIQYKTYSGWSGFNYVGTHYLKILWIKEPVWFYSDCKQDLEKMVWWAVMLLYKIIYKQVLQSLKHRNSDFVPNSNDDTLMTVTTCRWVFVFGN